MSETLSGYSRNILSLMSHSKYAAFLSTNSQIQHSILLVRKFHHEIANMALVDVSVATGAKVSVKSSLGIRTYPLATAHLLNCMISSD